MDISASTLVEQCKLKDLTVRQLTRKHAEVEIYYNNVEKPSHLVACQCIEAQYEIEKEFERRGLDIFRFLDLRYVCFSSK